MTDTRKPYEADWPHGYETSDGTKVTVRPGFDESPRLFWELPDGTLFTTYRNGIFNNNAMSAYDIFCTPAPVVERLERWANVRGGKLIFADDEKEANGAAIFASRKGDPYDRVAVHFREVLPGDLTAEDIEAQIAIWQERENAYRRNLDAQRADVLRDVVTNLRAASRGDA